MASCGSMRQNKNAPINKAVYNKWDTHVCSVQFCWL